MPVRPAAEIVGQVRDFRESETGAVDAFVILGEPKGLAAGYGDLNAARAAVVALPGTEVLKDAVTNYERVAGGLAHRQHRTKRGREPYWVIAALPPC